MVVEVDLTTVWLNLASNPSDLLRLRIATLDRVATVDGRTQRLAGGGIRMIRRAGAPVTWSLSMPAASRAQVEWLEAHIGQTVTARSHRGHKIHGVYLTVPVGESPVLTEGRTQMQLLEVSHTEVV